HIKVATRHDQRAFFRGQLCHAGGVETVPAFQPEEETATGPEEAHIGLALLQQAVGQRPALLRVELPHAVDVRLPFARGNVFAERTIEQRAAAHVEAHAYAGVHEVGPALNPAHAQPGGYR